MLLREQGFVVKEIDLGGAATLKQVDHPLGTGREMRIGQQVMLGGTGVRPVGIAGEQLGQRHCAETGTCAREKNPAVGL